MFLTLRLAWRNIWRQPRRTWLTTGAMVFSNVLLVFMISLQFGTYGLMINNTLQVFSGHMQVQAPGYVDDRRMRQTVPGIGALADSLRDGLGSETVAARARAFVIVSSEDRSYGIAVLGVEPEFEPRVSNLPGLITAGRYLDELAAAEIVVGAVLARNLGISVGDELTLLGSGLDGSFAATVLTVVGIFESGMPDIDRSFAEMPLSYFQDVFYMDGAGHEIVVNAPTLSEASAVRERVEELTAGRDDVVVQDWDALQPGLKQAIQADIGSAFFMYAVLVVLVAFSVLNTQLMSVLERTREFGIVMALGLTPGRLGALVLLETLLIALLGLLLGALVGGIVTYWVGIVGFSYPGMEEMAARFNLPANFHPRVTPVSLVAGPAVVLLFSICAALYPALRLHRLRPVDAMRAA